MNKTEQVEVKVRATFNSYQTGTVRGFRASCSSGPEQAARALGRKLYGEKLMSVTETERSTAMRLHSATHWRIEGLVLDQAKQ